MTILRSGALWAALVLGVCNVENVASFVGNFGGAGVRSSSTSSNQVFVQNHQQQVSTASGPAFRRGTSLFMSSRPQTGRDFYAILDLQRGADTAEIKAAYRKKARQYHPGKFKVL